MKHMTTFALLLLLFVPILSSGCHTTVSPPETEANTHSSTALSATASEEITTVTETTTAEMSVATSVTEALTTTGCTPTVTTATESVTAARPQTTVTTTKKHTSTTQRSTTAKPTTPTTTATQSKPVVLDTEVIAEELLRLINAERKALGLPLLNTAPIAHEIATVRARELQIVWSHYRPDGTTSGTIFTVYQYGEQNGRISIPDGNGGWTMVDAYSPGGTEDISSLSIEYTVTDPELIARAILYGQSDKMVSTHIPGLAGTGFKDSPKHWSDIINSEYTGVGIGVSFSTSEMFYYVCTAVEMMCKTYG